MSSHLSASCLDHAALPAASQLTPLARPFPKEANMQVLAASAPTDCPETESAGSECVALEVRRRLHSTGYHLLRLIESEYCNGTIVLRGRVPSYYLKQMAQSVLLTNPLVETIVNLIEVNEDGYRTIAAG
jgi:hypothetical protein